jgi:hypothetical protein
MLYLISPSPDQGSSQAQMYMTHSETFPKQESPAVLHRIARAFLLRHVQPFGQT